MKIKDGFILREICGEFVVVAVGDKVAGFNGIISLNESSKIIFDCLKKGLSKDAILGEFLKVYSVERERAEKDIDKVIATFKKVNIIDE